jgi:hypothetical protein
LCSVKKQERKQKVFFIIFIFKFSFLLLNSERSPKGLGGLFYAENYEEALAISFKISLDWQI